MFCEQAQEQLTSYHQDELDVTTREAVAQHLDTCEACRNSSDEIREVLSLFSSVGEFEPPQEVWQRIEAEISRPVDPPVAEPLTLSRPRWMALCGSIAATAAAVLLLALAVDGLLGPRGVTQVTLLSGELEHSTPNGAQPVTLGKPFTVWPGSGLTAAGQKARLGLGEKTSLTLDARSRVRFGHRLIELRQGRMLLDEQGGTRWRVRTPHLNLKLIGTEVDVEVTGGFTRLRVLSGAVELKDGANRLRVESGKELRYSTRAQLPLRDFNPELARNRWNTSAVVGKLRADRVGGKLVLRFTLTNASAHPVILASGSGRYCQLKVKRDGVKQDAIPVPLAEGTQPVRLAPGASHTLTFDAAKLGKPGAYEVQGLYLVGGQPRLHVLTPPLKFRIP